MTADGGVNTPAGPAPWPLSSLSTPAGEVWISPARHCVKICRPERKRVKLVLRVGTARRYPRSLAPACCRPGFPRPRHSSRSPDTRRDLVGIRDRPARGPRPGSPAATSSRRPSSAWRMDERRLSSPRASLDCRAAFEVEHPASHRRGKVVDENLRYFGPAYAEYRKRTKMFIPFLF